MSLVNPEFPIYLEVGSKFSFAGAIEWPGLCRKGRDASSAQFVLHSYSSRYKLALEKTGLEVDLPSTPSDFKIVEELEGDSTTDFGAPGQSPVVDSSPIDLPDLEFLKRILEACWLAFNHAAASAEGRSLRKGPRGGGRDLEKIIEHVLDANQAYLSRLAWKPQPDPSLVPSDRLANSFEKVCLALSTTVSAGKPERGPRGGSLWSPRYFVRRVAWHMLDHAWEIEDRIE
jgi:hypothetical protein